MATLADFPNSYAFMSAFMGDALIANAGWDNDTFVFIAQEALELYGLLTDEDDATDTAKYHALLRYKCLERFLMDTSADFDYQADGENFRRSQVFAQVQKMYEKARKEVSPYLAESQIEMGRVTFSDDPYSIDGQVEHDA